MTNIFKKMLVVLCISTLFVTPTIAHAATIDHVYENGKYKEIYYSPYDLFIINPGKTGTLENNVNNGAWYVNAEDDWLSFNANFIIPCSVRVILYNADTSQTLFTEELLNTPGLDFSFPIYESGNYRVILQPLYDTTLIMDNFKIWY